MAPKRFKNTMTIQIKNVYTTQGIHTEDYNSLICIK